MVKTTTKENKKQSNSNIYKISTYILVGIIVIVAAFFAITSYGDSRFNQGVQQGQLLVFQAVAQQGSAQIQEGNQTFSIVPAQAVSSGQQQLLQTIISQVQQEGYIVLGNDEQEVYLVQVQPNQLNQTN